MTTPQTIQPAVLNERDAAIYLGVSPFVLRQARLKTWAKPYNQPEGPVYLKRGRSVRYAIADLNEYIQRHRVTRTPARPQQGA